MSLVEGGGTFVLHNKKKLQPVSDERAIYFLVKLCVFIFITLLFLTKILVRQVFIVLLCLVVCNCLGCVIKMILI